MVKCPNCSAKLKTMKEIVDEHIKNYKDSRRVWEFKDLLNREIIRWIYHHRSYHNKIRDAIAKEFMVVFNITEEELKKNK